MKKGVLLIIAAMLTLSSFAQSSTDSYTVNKTDGTSEKFEIGDGMFNHIAFTADKMTNYITSDGADIAENETWNVADLSNVTFSVAGTPTQDSTYETAVNCCKNMGPGYNLGNTFESNSLKTSYFDPATASVTAFETLWGQPVTTQNLMTFLHKNGFGAVRLPVTWAQHMDADGNVDNAWMNRIQEVVDYIVNSGMYCILNTHHDNASGSVAWLKDDATNYTNNVAKFKKLWTQIANRFKNYGHLLVFEGFNEMLDGNNSWTPPTDEATYTVHNEWAQAFVDAVRATGGKNKTRNLLINPYAAANSETVLSHLTVPSDPIGNNEHIIVGVHTYDPYNFVINKSSWDSECQTYVTNMMSRLKTYFVDKGTPVLIGEYGTHGSDASGNYVSVTKKSSDTLKKMAADQAAQITKEAKAIGAPAFYWMNIIDGSDRSVPQWSLPTVVTAIINAYNN